MATTHVGADISQLAALRQQLEAKAGEVEALIHEISGAVGEPGATGSVHWQGQVADQFRLEWSGTFVPGLRRLAESLREHAAYVERNRQNISQALNGAAA
jgi:hypothetical protein